MVVYLFILLRLHYHSSMKRCFTEDYCINLYCSILCRKYSILLRADSYFYREHKKYFPFQAPVARGCMYSQFFFFWSVKINLKIESSYSKWIVLPVHLYGTFCRNRAEHRGPAQRSRSMRRGAARGVLGACPMGWCGAGYAVPSARPHVAPSQRRDPRLRAQGRTRHPKRFIISVPPGHMPSGSSWAPVGSSACKSSCRLPDCICHLATELLGNSPCCSYWGWVVKNSISVGISASASRISVV